MIGFSTPKPPKTMKNWQIPRRTFLKGLGTAMSLPMLCLIPAWAAGGRLVGSARAARTCCLLSGGTASTTLTMWRMPGTAATFRRTRPAFLEHEDAKVELKKLLPEDVKEAIGHGLRAKRSKSGAISFDLVDVEVADAAL